MCCCDGSSKGSHSDDDFIQIGMVLTCIIVVIDIIKIIISFVYDDKLTAVVELGMFVVTLAISYCLHPCSRNCSHPCIPGLLCLALLQVAGEVVKHMIIVHIDEEIDGSNCSIL